MAANKRTVGKQPPYNAYRFTSTAHQAVIVLAAGMWSAVGALLQWRVANGIGEVPFTVNPSWGAELTGVARNHIDEARSRCKEPSIATRYRAGSGWSVVAPMDERDDPD